INTIKDIVSQMPEDEEINTGEPESKNHPLPDQHKIHIEDIVADFQEMPVFEPVSQNGTQKKSLNDKLKNTNLNIGLNDKLAIIKHLFNGNVQDYERVVSQINTTPSFGEAKTLIATVVEPDYKWNGKEGYEGRLV